MGHALELLGKAEPNGLRVQASGTRGFLGHRVLVSHVSRSDVRLAGEVPGLQHGFGSAEET